MCISIYSHFHLLPFSFIPVTDCGRVLRFILLMKFKFLLCRFVYLQDFDTVGADIIRPPTGYAEHRRGRSRLSARSVLLPAAEVSTGDPHPSASRYQDMRSIFNQLSAILGRFAPIISPHPPLRGTLSDLGEGYGVRLFNWVINKYTL